jgi:hypothetical protein
MIFIRAAADQARSGTRGDRNELNAPRSALIICGREIAAKRHRIKLRRKPGGDSAQAMVQAIRIALSRNRI